MFFKKKKVIRDLRLDRNTRFVLCGVTPTLQGQRAGDKEPVNI
jgi:hypothetical protein